MELEIPKYIIDAQKHLNDFFIESEDAVFNIALSILNDKLGLNRIHFSKIISRFLQPRNIQPQPSLEQMLKMKEEEVRLVGMSHYFSRKCIQTSYDVRNPEITDPSPYLQHTFRATLPSNNVHAYHFLNGLRQLLAGSLNKEKQLKVMAAVQDILPEWTLRYKVESSKLQGKNGSTLHTSQKERLDEKFRQILSDFVSYSQKCIELGLPPSVQGFDTFLTEGSRRWDKRIYGR